MSIQCCPLTSGDDEPAKFHRKTSRQARKLHTCTECRESIAPGAKYEHVSGCWGSYVDTFKTCASCVEIRDHFACNGFIYGQIWEDIKENFFPTMRAGGPCMEGLSPEAKGRLFDLRLAWAMERDS